MRVLQYQNALPRNSGFGAGSSNLVTPWRHTGGDFHQVICVKWRVLADRQWKRLSDSIGLVIDEPPITRRFEDGIPANLPRAEYGHERFPDYPAVLSLCRLQRSFIGEQRIGPLLVGPEVDQSALAEIDDLVAKLPYQLLVMACEDDNIRVFIDTLQQPVLRGFIHIRRPDPFIQEHDGFRHPGIEGDGELCRHAG